jgi:hypothetical protein
MSDENATEAAIQAKNFTAPRLTPALINAAINNAQYYVFPGTVMTVCCITLKNGFNVIGHSAPASPANFDVEIGRNIAFNHAREQIWALEGYLLRDRLHSAEDNA